MSHCSATTVSHGRQDYAQPSPRSDARPCGASLPGPSIGRLGTEWNARRPSNAGARQLLDHEPSDARILAWDQQVADDAVAAQLQAPQQQVPEDPVPQAQPMPGENRDDAEKRKAKMKDFNDTTTGERR